jgi:hypothetical protein
MKLNTPDNGKISAETCRMITYFIKVDGFIKLIYGTYMYTRISLGCKNIWGRMHFAKPISDFHRFYFLDL